MMMSSFDVFSMSSTETCRYSREITTYSSFSPYTDMTSVLRYYGSCMLIITFESLLIKSIMLIRAFSSAPHVGSYKHPPTVAVIQ